MPGPGDVNVVNVITLVAIVTLVLCVAFASKAVTYDLVGLPIRAWTENRYQTKPSKWRYFLHKNSTCWWCLGFWISSLLVCPAALTAACLYFSNWWLMTTLPFLAPAVAYGAGWVNNRTVN